MGSNLLGDFRGALSRRWEMASHPLTEAIPKDNGIIVLLHAHLREVGSVLARGGPRGLSHAIPHFQPVTETFFLSKRSNEKFK
jgi:hypothetical protein